MALLRGLASMRLAQLAVRVKASTGGQRQVSEFMLRGLSTASASATVRPRATVSLLDNLKQLSKFRLSSLVVLTASAGFVAGSGEKMDWAGLAWTSLGTFGSAACANTLNQIYEVANDSRMSRTCNRPLPAGRMTRLQAAAFALTAGSLGVGILYTQTNELTAALGVANIVLYAGVYTPLKQISVLNTWVGALVGAIPPLMGWAAAAGHLEPGAYVLSAALFFWQLPHFFALAWLCKDDYLRGGFRMLSGIDPTGRKTAGAAFRNALFLLPLGVAAYAAGVTTQPFAWEAAALAAVLCVPASSFLATPTQATARKLFRSSLMYLPLLMTGLVVHRLPNDHTMTMGQMQQQVSALFEGRVEDGVLPALRASVEQSVLSLNEVLSSGKAKVAELRCPSTVHGDDVERAQRQSRASNSSNASSSGIEGDDGGTQG